MKLFFISLILIGLSVCTTHAQEVRWGAAAGANFATDSIMTFKAGAKMEYGLPYLEHGAFLDVSALLAMHQIRTPQRTHRPLFLQVPIHVGIRRNINGGYSSCFASAGGYTAYGLYGLNTSSGGGAGNCRRFNAGVGLKAGFDLDGVGQLSVGYDYALIGLYDNAKQGSFALLLAVMF
ncbi:MAG: hypothetical protein LBM61_03955 [Prevotellaceae bacterium]|jgi:hypothetical protein|nr:hypothetical protein [Prevotellaceae bacterium]